MYHYTIMCCEVLVTQSRMVALQLNPPTGNCHLHVNLIKKIKKKLKKKKLPFHLTPEYVASNQPVGYVALTQENKKNDIMDNIVIYLSFCNPFNDHILKTNYQKKKKKNYFYFLYFIFFFSKSQRELQ